eukprot:gene1475-2838_t
MNLRTVQPQAKYGLIKKSGATVPQKLAPRPSFFANDEDEEDISNANEIKSANRQILRQSDRIDPALQKLHASALAEDGNIFNYDEAYDSFKSKSADSHPLSKSSTNAPKSRYVNSLMAVAKTREKEKDRIFERNLLKERKKEDEEFGDAPKFVTAAYKKKLMEDRKWEYEDRLAEELEQRTDVRGRGMEGFYSNLLTKNLAMGGDVEASAVSAYTAGSVRQAVRLDGDNHDHPQHIAPESQAPSHSNSCDDKDIGNDDDYSSQRKRARHEDKEKDVKTAVAAVTLSIAHPNTEQIADKPDNVTNVSDNIPPVVKEVVVEVVVPRREEVVISAKERYLARKAVIGTMATTTSTKD